MTALAHRTDGGHWLMFNDERHIVGCHCGFTADPDDAGYGDSVLDHFEQVVRAEERTCHPADPAGGTSKTPTA